MGAVVRHGLCSAGVEAINAGIDLLLVSYDTQQYFEIFHCLLQAHRKGDLNLRTLQASDARLQKLTRSFSGLLGSTNASP
jgi:beta-N-acetylhexosaminidase